MLLRQSCKGGPKDYTVSTLQQARDIVGLMSVAYTLAISTGETKGVSTEDALEIVMDEHEIYGIMKEMLLDFGDCRFTLIMSNGNKFVMSHDFIQFEKEEVS